MRPPEDPLAVVGRYDSTVLEAGSRRRNPPAPPAAIREALTEPNRDPDRPWLSLLEDEQPPGVEVNANLRYTFGQ